jgi:hypothetical protein
VGLPAEDLRRGSPRARAEARRQRQIRGARERCEDFVEYAIPHEKTGKPVKNAPFHVEWQQLLREHKYVVLIAPVEHAKTAQIAIAKPIHVLGHDPSLRGAIISNTATQAQKSLGSITQHIERNPRVREVFPRLVPTKRANEPWRGDMITVDRPTYAKDPSIQAVGVGGPIVGSRLDWAVLDDVLDFENTRTPEQLNKLIEWFDSTLFPRMVEGAPIWVIGTPWNRNDLLHVLAKRPAWVSRTYSAVENPDDPQDQWRPIWFGLERLIEIQANTTAHNFARKYLCRILLDTLARFQRAWIDQCVALGKGRTLVKRAPRTPGGRLYPCFTGVDLGVGQDEGHDLSVLFTIALLERMRRLVVDIQAGHWTGPEILRRIYDVQRRFDSVALVEDNAAQKFLLQWATEGGIAVRPFTTTAQNKSHEAFGLENVAVEMRAGLWIIPSGASGADLDPEVLQWIQEMEFYQPGAHTGDRLMASWFAREGAREVAMGITQDNVDTQKR